MKFTAMLVAATAAVTASTAVVAMEDKVLVSFPGGIRTNFRELNDPVMGGQSVGNFTKVDGEYGLFQGEVKNVTSLHAPGFCNIQVLSGLRTIDISEYVQDSSLSSGGIKLKIEYAQSADEKPFAEYRFGMSGKSIPKHGGEAHELEGSYKGNFNVKPTTGKKNGEDCQIVHVPFSSFSSDWSDFTGTCDFKDPDGTQHHCCDSAHADVCPSQDHTKDLTALSIWAEGVEGPFALKIYEINVTASIESDTMGPC